MGGASETSEQAAVVEWCELFGLPIVHIPNEGKRSKSYGATLKRAGMRKGFPDLFLPLAKRGYHGFFIEMKYGKGRLSQEQGKWLSELKNNGYATAVCYSADDAVRLIKKYVEDDK